MVKRLILASLLAAGGAGVYVFGSGATGLKSDSSDSATASDRSGGEWQVEYVDGEGNPIQRDSGLRATTGRFKLTSKPFLKRLSGASTGSPAGG